jgi:hypothetical protein
MARDHIDLEGMIPAYIINSCAPAKRALFSPAAALLAAMMITGRRAAAGGPPAATFLVAAEVWRATSSK